jgi:hypothetical protein
MKRLEYELCQRGLLLFVFGLALGFFISAFPVRPMARAAHEAALQSGTFLIAIGWAWPKLNWSALKSTILARLSWISFYCLTLGLTCAALLPQGAAAAGASRGIGPVVANVLNIGSSVLMLVVSVLVLFAFRGVRVGDAIKEQ